MSNPYHDAEGRFCSRGEMQQALTQLVANKDVNTYLSLREAWEQIEDKNQTELPLSIETEHTVTIPNSFGDWTLVKGKLNPKSAIALTTGPCANFAQELHKKTGWPLIAVVQKGSYGTAKEFNDTWADYDDSGMMHILVQRPDGKLVDATGVKTKEQYIAETEPNHGSVTLYKTTAKFAKANSDPRINPKHLSSFVDAAITMSENNQRIAAKDLAYAE